jgi:lipoate-protein ligase A
MNELRLLVDLPASGAWNMAVDEVLLESAAARGIDTLRFYEWEEPTLSLGYFQASADRAGHAASLACPLVRRASGGGAIVHDRELTYSITLARRSLPAAAAADLYALCHETLVEALAELGVAAALFRPTMCVCGGPSRRSSGGEPFLCFQRRGSGDVLCGQAKIAGSAQRRRKGAVLQHGSLLLARSPAAPEIPGLLELTGTKPAAARITSCWTPRLATRLGASPEIVRLTDTERDAAMQLARQKFSAADFSYRR